MRLLLGSSRVLVDEALPEEERAAIHAEVVAFGDRGVVGYHQLRTRRAGARRYVDLHLQFEAGTSLEQAHEIAHAIQDAIAARLRGADVLIHLEPADRVRPGTEWARQPSAALDDRRLIAAEQATAKTTPGVADVAAREQQQRRRSGRLPTVDEPCDARERHSRILACRHDGSADARARARLPARAVGSTSAPRSCSTPRGEPLAGDAALAAARPRAAGARGARRRARGGAAARRARPPAAARSR